MEAVVTTDIVVRLREHSIFENPLNLEAATEIVERRDEAKRQFEIAEKYFQRLMALDANAERLHSTLFDIARALHGYHAVKQTFSDCPLAGCVLARKALWPGHD